MKKKFGNCYEAAFKTLFHNVSNRELRLVHGEVIGNKPGTETYNKPIGHAWIEMGNVVIDPSDHFEWPKIFDKTTYYEMAQIEVTNLKTYSIADAITKAATNITYGPWLEGEQDFSKLDKALEKYS